MTRSRIPQNQIAVNLIALLKPHLRGCNCKVLSSDAKVAVADDEPLYCLGISVTCNDLDLTARNRTERFQTALTAIKKADGRTG